ncbi:hypothetical protein BDR04DRAFT_1173081 [Suillus decipiens]|nr:hypothetical protein BDR04DRAFT_1173081 [Suillus decipiens]
MQRPIAGGQANEKDQWENLLMTVKTYPLKSPYSQLSLMQQMMNDYCRDTHLVFGGIQSVKCCNLTVCTFKTLGKLHNNYSYHVHQHVLAAGQPVCQKHAYMHTQNNDGIDMDLAMDLNTNFAWTPPLVSQSV